MNLSAYVARLFSRSLIMIALIFAAILFLIDFIEEIRRFARSDIGMTGAAKLAALNITSSFYSILPLITLLAAITLFLNLSRTSQLVAMRASGRSGIRITGSPTVTAALYGILAVAILNPLVAATSKQYDVQVARIEANGAETISLGESAVWLRQSLVVPSPDGEKSGQIVIRANRASPDATTLYNATFMLFTPDEGPIGRIEAEKATLRNGNWHLTNSKEWPLTADNPELVAVSHATLDIPTELTAERIRDGFGAPESVPFWQLPGYIRDLERAGFSAQRHKVWFQTELARPLMMVAMVLVAAVFTMRNMRGRKMGVLVLGAFASGVVLFFLRNMAQVLGDNGDIPPVLAGWAPPLIAIMFALGVLLQLEDG